MAAAAAVPCSHTLRPGLGSPARLGRSALSSRAALCPPALRCRRLALQQRRRGRAPAPRVTAALPAVAAVAAPAVAAVSKALLLGVAASWVSCGPGFGSARAAAVSAASRRRPEETRFLCELLARRSKAWRAGASLPCCCAWLPLTLPERLRACLQVYPALQSAEPIRALAPRRALAPLPLVHCSSPPLVQCRRTLPSRTGWSR